MVLFCLYHEKKHGTAFFRLVAAPILTPTSKLFDGLAWAPELEV